MTKKKTDHDVSADPATDSTGSPQASSGRELHKRAVERLKKSDQMIKGILDISPVGLVFTVDGKIKWVNEAWVRIFGFTNEREYMDQPTRILYPSEKDYEETRSRVYANLQEARINELIAVMMRHEGTLFHASLRIGFVDPSDPSQGTMSVIADISERVRAEEALRESEEKYRNLIERANDGIVIVQDGIVKYINARLAEMRGVTVEEVIGTPFTDHIYPDELPGVVDRYKQRMAGEDVSPIYETALRRRDGSKIHTELNAGIVTYQGKPADLVIIRDITERKRAEEEIRKTAKELEQKNAELERFTSAISHDLRSPLVTIQTFEGHLERDIRSQDAARVEKDLGYIRNAADKMGRLLDELRRFSRVGRIINPAEEAPLQAIVKEALSLAAGRIADRGVRIDLTEEPVVLYGDRTRLVEVFLNLVDNAIKFMGDEPAPRVEIGAEQTGEEIVLQLRDNGIGIDPEVQPYIFDLFHKFNPGSEGEGIGLSLVKRIVELHGGRIWVESEGLGKGTTFRFTLAKTRRRRAEEEKP